MSYTNYINKLSSETKKALEESSSVNHEIQDLKKYKYSMKHLNDNSIGYTIKYKIKIDDELKHIINSLSYEILMCYFIENEIFTNQFHIVYKIYRWKNDTYISFFHTNRDYLQNVHHQIIQNIMQSIKEISRNIQIKFSNSINLPFTLQIKILKKEYPVLIQTICNMAKIKKIENSEEIINSIIKILQINELQIIESSCVHVSTYQFQEDPIDYLGSLKSEDTENSETSMKADDEQSDNLSVNKNIEFINNNIRELFWHATTDSKKNKNKESSKIGHSLFFTLIFAAVVYFIPKYFNKLADFGKNNVVIDNILDLATEDLTQTNINKKTKNFSKLDPIIEQNEPNEPNEPYEPNEPSEPSDQQDELKIIASNILKKYNESSSSNQNRNIELKNIKNRLKLILEETSTN